MYRQIVLISGSCFGRIFYIYIIITSKTRSTDNTHDGTHSIHISNSAHVLAHTTNHISTEINKNAGQQQPNQIIKEMKNEKSSLSTHSRFYWIVWLSQINVFIFVPQLSGRVGRARARQFKPKDGLAREIEGMIRKTPVHEPLRTTSGCDGWIWPIFPTFLVNC